MPGPARQRPLLPGPHQRLGLPDSFAGYGFLSYESQPLPTRHCSAAEVLRFRDDAWQKYFTNPAYLALVERKFGPEQRRNVQAMAAIKLRRRLLGDPPPENTPLPQFPK